MNREIYIIIRNDDVCALSDPIKERKVLEVFEKYRIPQSICITPKVTEDSHDCFLDTLHPLMENEGIVELLQEYQEKNLVEIAQHGYTHQTNEFHPSKEGAYTSSSFMQGIDRKWLPYSPANGCYSEFNGLSYDEKMKKILSGREIIEEALGVRVQTFSFPWDSFDQESLDILDELEFKNVLSGDNVCRSGRFSLVTNSGNKILSILNFIKGMESLKYPVLAHITYHSWILDEESLQKLDDILSQLSKNGNIKFIRPSQVIHFFPNFKRVQSLKCYLDVLTNRANIFLGKKKEMQKFFVFNTFYYILSIIRTWILGFLAGTLHHINIRKDSRIQKQVKMKEYA